MSAYALAQVRSASARRLVKRGGSKAAPLRSGRRQPGPTRALPGTATQQEVESAAVTPTEGRVLVKPEESEGGSKTTAGGVILAPAKGEDAFANADSVKVGTVLAVGEGVETMKKGDKVLYSNRGSTEVTFADGPVWLCRAEQIVAKVDD